MAWIFCFADKNKDVRRFLDHNLRGMIQNKEIVVAKGNKDSSVVIMRKSDYVTKLDTMIDDGIVKGTYSETTDSTLKKL